MWRSFDTAKVFIPLVLEALALLLGFCNGWILRLEKENWKRVSPNSL
jgi:hypothetical protein